MNRRIPRWAVLTTLAVLPAAALAATAGSQISDACGWMCSALFGC